MINCGDKELLARWADGDRRAGQELYNRHFVAVRKFFRNTASSNVEALVQTAQSARRF